MCKKGAQACLKMLSTKHVYKLCYICMYERRLALNNEQVLIWYKIQTKLNQTTSISNTVQEHKCQEASENWIHYKVKNVCNTNCKPLFHGKESLYKFR